MKFRHQTTCGLWLATGWLAAGQEPPAATINIPLKVDSGFPLRLYITQRLRMKLGQPVTAKLVEPVYAFDRIVVPAGAEALGQVTKLDPVPKMVRAQAILNGDFTPLHFARVEFTTVRMPDGREIAIHTLDSQGLQTIYSPPRPSKKKPKKVKDAQPKPPADPMPNPTLKEAARQQIHQEIKNQINARTQGVADLVRGPNKMERIEQFLLAKLPYHPQWYYRGTRFDAVLTETMDFGAAAVAEEALRTIGTEANLDRMVELRLISSISSGTATVGDKLEAVLAQPLFSGESKLLMPEGTRLTGTVKQVRRARWFHRPGQLRFTFDQIDTPAVASLRPRPPQRTVALLQSAESDPSAGVKIDSEGSAKASEPLKRLLAPALAAMIAMRTLDNDTGRQGSAGGGENGNAGGRALGGFSGFGFLGTLAARNTPSLASALGFYSLAWSVYSSVISRGHEVDFEKNTSIVVRFGARERK